LLDLEALLLQAVGDVEVGDRAEQAAIDAGLLDDANVRAGETLAERTRALDPLVLHFLELRTPVLEFLERRRRGATGLPGGNQVVAREPVAHLDDVAELSEVDDFLEQDDLHVGSRA